jgi:hypothetical protein
MLIQSPQELVIDSIMLLLEHGPRTRQEYLDIADYCEEHVQDVSDDDLLVYVALTTAKCFRVFARYSCE